MVIFPGFFKCNLFLNAPAEERTEDMVLLSCRKIELDVDGCEVPSLKSYYLNDIEKLISKQ